MKKRLSHIIVLSIVLSFICPIVYSQVDVDRATREVDRSLRKEAEEKLRVPPKKIPEIKEEKKEPEEEGLKFFVKEIKLVGWVSLSPDDFKSIVEKYENKELSLEELDILAKEIEREYLKRGVIAACFLPPQDIKEGVVILQIVEAKMGELEIEDHKYFSKDRLPYYWSIPPGEVLRYDGISRSLQLMNKNPDREVKATLRAGKKPKTTDVLLNVKTNLPIHIISSYDREGILSTGVARKGTGIRYNNFLGIDDILLSGYTSGKYFSGIYAYHSVPITNFGTSVLYGYSYSKSFPKMDYKAFSIDSRARNASCFIHQDLFKKDKYIGEYYYGLDANDKTTRMNTGAGTAMEPRYRDKLRVARIGGSYIHREFDSVTSIKPEFSQGLNAFGARRAGLLASRRAKNTFSKFSLGIEHKKALPVGPLNLQANLKFKGQVASTKLTPQEEFSLGGIDSVRGYPSMDYLADDALLANAELLIPAFFIPEEIKLPYAARPLKQDTTFLAFCDYGYGQKRFPSATDKQSANMVGLGAGVRVKFFDQALVRLEWGFPMHGVGETERANSRFHFSVAFEDRIPQEIERIDKLIQEASLEKRVQRLLNAELKRLDSPIRQKLYNYLYLAQAAYKEGDLEESKLYYEKLADIGESLYEQTDSYVRGCFDHEKQLKEYEKLALKYFKEGDFDKAKEIWEKVLEEAKGKPLVLEF